MKSRTSSTGESLHDNRFSVFHSWNDVSPLTAHMLRQQREHTTYFPAEAAARQLLILDFCRIERGGGLFFFPFRVSAICFFVFFKKIKFFFIKKGSMPALFQLILKLKCFMSSTFIETTLRKRLAVDFMTVLRNISFVVFSLIYSPNEATSVLFYFRFNMIYWKEAGKSPVFLSVCLSLTLFLKEGKRKVVILWLLLVSLSRNFLGGMAENIKISQRHHLN